MEVGSTITRELPLGRRTAIVAGLVAVAALSVALRLPFLNVPLTADEGGYAYVAWFWQQGDTLYRDLWVDRPQLLVLAYQAAFSLVGEATWQLRLAAATYAAASVLAVSLLTARVLGWRLGVLAGALCAVVAASPRIEGFTFNGELLTTLPSTLGVLALVAWSQQHLKWSRDGTSAWALSVALPVLAGAAGAASFLFKQSGIDVLFVALTLFVTMIVASSPGRMRVLASAGLFALGLAVPLGIAIVHGLGEAGDDYLYAVFGYRLAADNVLAMSIPERWELFTTTLPQVLRALGPLLLLAPFGWVMLWRSGIPGRVVVAWSGALAVGVVVGGQFHPHYYVALVPALAITTAAGASWISRAPGGRGGGVADTGVGWGSGATAEAVWRVVLAAACVWLVAGLVDTVRLAAIPEPKAVSWQVFADPRYLTSDDVGRWLRDNTRPGERVLAMYAGADLYWYARRRSPYPYLWFRGIATIPGAPRRLRSVLDDPERHPAWVAAVQPPGEIDPSGRLRRVLERHYDRVATVDGVPIWRADGRTL